MYLSKIFRTKTYSNSVSLTMLWITQPCMLKTKTLNMFYVGYDVLHFLLKLFFYVSGKSGICVYSYIHYGVYTKDNSLWILYAFWCISTKWMEYTWFYHCCYWVSIYFYYLYDLTYFGTYESDISYYSLIHSFSHSFIHSLIHWFLLGYIKVTSYLMLCTHLTLDLNNFQLNIHLHSF